MIKKLIVGVILTLIVVATILFIRYSPTNTIIKVNYKFEKDNQFYIIGEITTPKNNGKIDLYKVDYSFFEEAFEGYEYSITINDYNSWEFVNKKVLKYQPIKYD